jgi:hypothetical protein
MVHLQVTLHKHTQMKGFQNLDASMSKICQSLGVSICCTLCICDVQYTSPSFVINVVILDKTIFKHQNILLFQKYFSPTFFYSKWDGKNCSRTMLM